MNSFRPVLEVHKWLPPESILFITSFVSSLWLQVSNSDELWIVLSESQDFTPTRPPDQSFKDGFRELLCSNPLYLLLPSSLHKFNCRNGKFTHEITFKENLEADYAVSAVVLPEQGVVLCGGEARSAFSFDWDGRMMHLADMHSPRSFHSAVHYKGVLYVFGGDSEGTAEKLQISPFSQAPGQSWRLLPKPSVRHSACVPCVHSGQIYLCGGNTKFSEVFQIETELYSLLPFTLPETMYGCASFMRKGQLIMVTQGFVSRWMPGSDLESTEKTRSYSGMWTNTPQCLLNEYVYSSVLVK